MKIFLLTLTTVLNIIIMIIGLGAPLTITMSSIELVNFYYSLIVSLSLSNSGLMISIIWNYLSE